MIDDVAQTEAQMNLALMNTGIPQPGICNWYNTARIRRRYNK
jgi:hypothetical protein